MWHLRSLLFRLSLLSVGLLVAGLLVSIIVVAAEIQLWLRLSLLLSLTIFLCGSAVVGIYRLLRPLSGYIHALTRDWNGAEAFDVESCEDIEKLKTVIKGHTDKTGQVVEALRLELNFLQSQSVRLGDGFASLKNKLQETIEYQRSHSIQLNSMIGGLGDNERVSSALLGSYGTLTKNLDHSSLEIGEATKILNQAKHAQRGRVEKLMHLMRDFEEIDEAIRRIHLISDQTKIVAFNAGIEASASGDLGRRFGVVAGDIRNLAQNVEKINRDIRRVVENLREGLTGIVDAASEDSKRVENALNRVQLTSDDLHQASKSSSVSFQGNLVPVGSLQSLWSSHREENLRQNRDLEGLAEKFTTQLEEFENRLNRFTYQVNGMVL
ncbi:MAG: methyl-accepting chemotaxis protein [Bacteroidetes bacterium]|nr:methyl-accepting chemotaxis protein [Bacteroidota bacterium]